MVLQGSYAHLRYPRLRVSRQRREGWESAVAGEREQMQVPRFVEMADALAMGGRHATIVPAGRPGDTPGPAGLLDEPAVARGPRGTMIGSS